MSTEFACNMLAMPKTSDQDSCNYQTQVRWASLLMLRSHVSDSLSEMLGVPDRSFTYTKSGVTVAGHLVRAVERGGAMPQSRRWRSVATHCSYVQPRRDWLVAEII